ncbi:DUF6221 family protein [Streptomyces olivaceoviridis]|uniref:DUF6221 family protein n=1 Tax=Streptomyces olivaceoviridis TaxID=1921 RepID=UPI0033A3E72A
MDELVQFLKDRYDEEAAAARAAIDVVGPILGAGRWRYTKSNGDEGGRYWSVTTTAPDSTVPMPTVELVGSGMSGGGVHEEAVAVHIVRHDPARVLREVEAKRQIVATYLPPDANPHPGLPCINYEGQRPIHYDDAEPCWRHQKANERLVRHDYVLRLLALPYADHPDYREEWAP